MSNALNRISIQKEKLLHNQENLLQELWELKLLKYKEQQINIISAYSDSMCSFIRILNRIIFEENSNEDEYKQITHQIRDLFKAFVDSAQEGLL